MARLARGICLEWNQSTNLIPMQLDDLHRLHRRWSVPLPQPGIPERRSTAMDGLCTTGLP